MILLCAWKRSLVLLGFGYASQLKSSIVLLRQIQSLCEKKILSLVWFFDICDLQFGIVREICYCLVLVLWFCDFLSLGLLQILDLICGSLWFVFGSLVCICERAI